MSDKQAWKKIYQEEKEYTKSIVVEIIKFVSGSTSWYIFDRYEYKYPNGLIHITDGTILSISNEKQLNCLKEVLKDIEGKNNG